jgi:hypothetical protein
MMLSRRKAFFAPLAAPTLIAVPVVAKAEPEAVFELPRVAKGQPVTAAWMNSVLSDLEGATLANIKAAKELRERMQRAGIPDLYGADR